LYINLIGYKLKHPSYHAVLSSKVLTTGIEDISDQGRKPYHAKGSL